MQKNFAASFVLGGVVWALSPMITGSIEPWDAQSPYYLLSLAASGLALGLWSPRQIWVHYLGAVLGQLAYLLAFIGASPFIVLGVFFLMGYSTAVLAGAYIGSRARSTHFVNEVDEPGT